MPALGKLALFFCFAVSSFGSLASEQAFDRMEKMREQMLEQMKRMERRFFDDFQGESLFHDFFDESSEERPLQGEEMIPLDRDGPFKVDGHSFASLVETKVQQKGDTLVQTLRANEKDTSLRVKSVTPSGITIEGKTEKRVEKKDENSSSMSVVSKSFLETIPVPQNAQLQGAKVEGPSIVDGRSTYRIVYQRKELKNEKKENLKEIPIDPSAPAI